MKCRSIFILGLALAGCSKKDQKPFEMPPVPVHTAEVEVRDVPLHFEAMGVVRAAKSASVKPQVNGVIKAVHFSEGEWVEENALLYTLDDAAYAIRVHEIEAQLEQEIAHCNSAKKKLERYRSLTKQDLISQVEWDQIETQVLLHEGMVKAVEARLAAAKLDLEHCQIRAPIAGYAGKSALSEGNLVAGEPLVTLTQSDPLLVDFSITEKELPLLNSQTPLIKVYAAGNEECLAAGKVTFLDRSIDPKSGMLAAAGTLAKSTKPLWPGQSVRVHLYFGKKEKARLVPMGAVKINQEGPYIFVVKEDQTVEVRTVTLGSEEKGQVVVESGLEETDKVVTQGQHRLFPGSKVEEVR